MLRLNCTVAALVLAGVTGGTAQAPTVSSTRGLVVTASAPATDIGAATLRSGGNAIDAAIATAFAMAVTYPTAGNIGGGGFMVIRLANGTTTTIDYRERAPGQSTESMYLDSAGAIDRSATRSGYRAAGVPGTVRGLALAHRRFGRLPWKQLVMPSAELARRGFPLSPALASELNWLVGETRTKYPTTAAAYGRPDGGTWAAGDTIRLPDLATTLDDIAKNGPDAFYTGRIADLIAADMAANGGLITKADLAGYRAVERRPVRGTFNGYQIYGMAPPSSGGIAVVTMLNILERFEIGRRARMDPATVHLMIEAQRRAFLDRAEYLGDPGFVSVPVARLTSKAHAATLAGSIDTTKASSSIALSAGRIAVSGPGESEETTHFSVVDGQGNAVANTYTLEQAYGSQVVVRGAGFLLNNEMGDFNQKPGTTTIGGDIGTAANLIVPGKRMLSSMSPTIVAKDGKVVLVTGSPGGRTIINTVHQIVLNVTAFGMDVRSAVDAPRFHHQWLPETVFFEAGAIPDSSVARLVALGHSVRVGGRIGNGHSIAIDPKTRVATAANDTRGPDSKAAAP
ncbi:MAG: gamma-glutamyltransferase [Gemmatimonadetes bacterium]|nr:gamma-glutamyltransferase [Gemmatimonadota bacterium]